MPAKSNSHVVARLFCGLLRLKLGQEALGCIFLLSIRGVLQELLDLGYGIGAVPLALIDLGQEQIKRRLIVIDVNLHGLQRIFLCFNGIVQVKVSLREVVMCAYASSSNLRPRARSAAFSTCSHSRFRADTSAAQRYAGK